MSGPGAVKPEVTGSINNSGPKMVVPDPVHHHAHGKGIFFIGKPVLRVPGDVPHHRHPWQARGLLEDRQLPG